MPWAWWLRYRRGCRRCEEAIHPGQGEDRTDRIVAPHPCYRVTSVLRRCRTCRRRSTSSTYVPRFVRDPLGSWGLCCLRGRPCPDRTGRAMPRWPCPLSTGRAASVGAGFRLAVCGLLPRHGDCAGGGPFQEIAMAPEANAVASSRSSGAEKTRGPGIASGQRSLCRDDHYFEARDDPDTPFGYPPAIRPDAGHAGSPVALADTGSGGAGTPGRRNRVAGRWNRGTRNRWLTGSHPKG